MTEVNKIAIGRDFRKVIRQFVYLCCVLLLAPAGTTFAQFLDQGAITGVVQDSTGAVVPGAQVTLTNTDTDLVLHYTTNSSGVFIFSPIVIGHYKISVSATGFQNETQENITLNLQQTLNLPITLTAGSVSQTVTVTTAPPLLQTEGGAVGQVVTTQQINNTPLNGRNAIFIAQLTAGAVPSTSRAKGSGDFDANGMRAEQNNFLLDGMDNQAITQDLLGNASFLINPPPDALAEFKVTTANNSAEFGHSAGAVLNASIKAGTNNFHGDIWEYWRNDALDARSFDALTIPEFRENLFGATLGGPVMKNKLFFFGDVQATRIAAGQPYTQSVPTLLERQGNFSELLTASNNSGGAVTTLYEPNTAGNQPMVCNGQKNVLCPNQIDPVAQKILNLYPLPNANGGKAFNNNTQNLSQPQNTVQWDARMDWNITSKDQAFARFSFNNQMGNYAGALGPILDGSGGEGSVYVSGLQVNYGNSFVGSETHIFNPSLVNDFRFGYNYGHFDTYQLNFNTNIAATLGMGGMPFGPGVINNGGLPTLSISSIASAGTHAYRPEQEFMDEYQILDNVSKTLGKHSIRVGVSLQNLRSYTLEPPASHGSYTFNGTFTGSPGVANTGNGQADFLVDQMDGGSIGPSSVFNDAQWYISGYGQDDYRLTPRLTLNLGVRYDWFEPYRELAGAQANFYVTGPLGIQTGSGQLTYPAKDQGNLQLSPAFLTALAKDNIALKYSSNPALSSEQKTNFGPRFGFSYHVANPTVVRGGFGFFYQGQQEAGAADNIGSNFPFVFSDSFPAPSCSKGAASCQNNGYTLESGFAKAVEEGLTTFVSNPSLNGQSINLKTTYAMNYNLTVQQAVSNNLVVSVGYVGTEGRHVPYGPNLNATTAMFPSGTSTQSYLPFPDFGGATVILYEGISSYNGLQLNMEKRMSSGLDFFANYTWSHSLDDATQPLGGGISYRDQNIIPPRDEYTNSGWDTRQRVIFNGYYELPLGQGRMHPIQSRLLDTVLGGWATNVTFQAQTGQPFTVGTSNISTVAGGTANAILLSNPYIGGGTPNSTNPSISCPAKVHTLQHWYNPCAFANPLPSSLLGTPGYTSGTIGKTPYVTGLANGLAFLGGRSNTVFGPGYTKVDMSLFKNFTTFREQYFQFRADAFNVLNTPEYGNPSTSNDSTNGGLITAGRSSQAYTPGARFLQLSAKYVF